MTVTLTTLQRIPTSGARAVCAFTVGGRELLAIPQLATDVPGTPAGMNVGDSDTQLLLFEREDGAYRPLGSLPAPGGEDAEFFTIGDRAFLAVASIRSGAGPYDYGVESTIFEWVGGEFVPFQKVPGFAAKQWKHWQIGERHFLGLAQGVDLPHITEPNRHSTVYEWDGQAFAPVQEIPSRWGYNWHALTVDGQVFVAHADHLEPSVLYRWDGAQLVPHQELIPRVGRAFADFAVEGHHYLIAAGLAAPPRLLRWSGTEFEPIATLDGLGAREVRVITHGDQLFVLRINFIEGTPQDPHLCTSSRIYAWRDGALEPVLDFPTNGGTDVEVLATTADGVELAVSNSLSADFRFATDTVVHALAVTA